MGLRFRWRVDKGNIQWVVSLQGATKLRFEEEEIELKPGDFVKIPAHKRHRVEWTTSKVPTIW